MDVPAVISLCRLRRRKPGSGLDSLFRGVSFRRGTRGCKSPIFNFQSAQAITPHIAALCIVFPITLLTGFWLQKYVTFTQSNLHGARQLARYILVVVVNLAVNYYGLKLCVETLGWWPTLSKIIITIVTVAISYFCQKYFTFRKK